MPEIRLTNQRRWDPTQTNLGRCRALYQGMPAQDRCGIHILPVEIYVSVIF